jgi:SNF2 family DNA or RNA helicase
MFAPHYGEDEVAAVAVEQQAIGRVFRPGQTRDVEVHRILLAESIDEALFRRNTNAKLVLAATSAN